ncbi:MAG: hypothetical protein ACXWW4_10995, partial [Candidatus Binatia bacterium]
SSNFSSGRVVSFFIIGFRGQIESARCNGPDNRWLFPFGVALMAFAFGEVRGASFFFEAVDAPYF